MLQPCDSEYPVRGESEDGIVSLYDLFGTALRFVIWDLDSIRTRIISGSSALLPECMSSSQSILNNRYLVNIVVLFSSFSGPTVPLFVPKGLAYTRPHKFGQAFSFSKLGHRFRAKKTRRRISSGRTRFTKSIFFKLAIVCQKS